MPFPLLTLSSFSPSLSLSFVMQQHFYTKNGTLDHETVVVNRMFAQAAANNVTVQQATTQLHDIARVLVEGNLVILLVDSRTLRCSECKKGKSFGGGFVGHYIVLCGYQPHDLSFVYMDPARDHGTYSHYPSVHLDW